MSGLCGWIGAGTDDAGTGNAALQGMLAALPAYGGCRRETMLGDGFSLGLNARNHEAHWYEDDAVVVAIEGYPRWSGAAGAVRDTADTVAAPIARAWTGQALPVLERIAGPFTLALIDKKRGEALLAIDRTGTGTLCVADAPGGGTVFGSTTDAVAAFPGIGKTVTPQALYNFFYFVDRIPAPDTIFAEQTKLVPGEYLHVTKGGVRRGLYWRMAYSNSAGQETEAFAGPLMQRLREAVANAAENEPFDRIGAFLSGGLDSSTVVALLSEKAKEPVHTFTISFAEDAFDESFYADKVVEKFHSRHSEYAVTPKDVFDLIPGIAGIYDEPFANHSAVPAFYCAKVAKDAGMEVMLAGDGGDELFAGNSRYVTERVFDHYRRVPAPLRHALLDPVTMRLAAAFPSVDLFRRGRNYIRIAKLSLAARMARHNIFEHLGVDEIFMPDAAAAIDREAPIRLAEAVYEAEAAPSTVHAMMGYDRRITLADSDLRKVNRMCELAGLRVRYPFLDDPVVDFSGTVPEKILLEGGVLRAFYKKAVSGLLPPEVIAKKKHGFGLPFLEYSDAYPPLRDLVCDSVADLKKRNLFRREYLDGMIAAHRGAENGLPRAYIWDLMIVELWWRHHG